MSLRARMSCFNLNVASELSRYITPWNWAVNLEERAALNEGRYLAVPLSMKELSWELTRVEAVEPWAFTRVLGPTFEQTLDVLQRLGLTVDEDTAFSLFGATTLS